MLITLCGSARFESEFKKWNETLTLAGHTVFSLAVYPSDKGGKNWHTAKQKFNLDKVHKDKIRRSDAILVLNCKDYIGESTASEIEYALELEKTIYLLFPHNALGKYYDLAERLSKYTNRRRMCPYPGCENHLEMVPPCAICYE